MRYLTTDSVSAELPAAMHYHLSVYPRDYVRTVGALRLGADLKLWRWFFLMLMTFLSLYTVRMRAVGDVLEVHSVSIFMVEVSSVTYSVGYGKILPLSRQRWPYFGVYSVIRQKSQSAVQVSCIYNFTCIQHNTKKNSVV
jgi:hypothetical protein